MTTRESLDRTTIACLAAAGAERAELIEPKAAFEDAGARVQVISPEPGQIPLWDDGEWADSIGVDHAVANVDHEGFDALLLPGGVLNTDRLRRDRAARAFAEAFFRAGKPIMAICHGPQLLIECRVLVGRRLTSHPAIATDLKNAGALWIDREVVVDQHLTTSRTPADLPAFIRQSITQISKTRAPHANGVLHTN